MDTTTTTVAIVVILVILIILLGIVVNSPKKVESTTPQDLEAFTKWLQANYTSTQSRKNPYASLPPGKMRKITSDRVYTIQQVVADYLT